MKRYLLCLYLVMTLGLTLQAGTDSFAKVFKEDLRFGGGDETDMLWLDAQLACDFEVTDNGHIFVIDQRNATIFEFDPKGKLVRKLATRGQGPGEYQAVSGLSLLGDGSGVGLDFLDGTLKLNHYGKGAIFKDANLVPNLVGFPFKTAFHHDAGLLQLIRSSETQTMSIEIVDKNLKTVKLIHSVSWPRMDNSRVGDPNAWVEYMGKQFKGFFEITNRAVGFLPDGRIVIGDGPKGTYEVWDKDHRTKLNTIKVDYPPKLFTEEKKNQLVEAITTILFKQGGPELKSVVTPGVVDRAVDAAKLPPSQSPIYDLIPVEGNIFAAVIDPNFAEGTMMLDFIDSSKGRVGTVAFKERGAFSVFGTRVKFNKGYAYAMVWNEDDENQIVRYKLDLSALKR